MSLINITINTIINDKIYSEKFKLANLNELKPYLEIGQFRACYSGSILQYSQSVRLLYDYEIYMDSEEEVRGPTSSPGMLGRSQRPSPRGFVPAWPGNALNSQRMAI